MASRSIKFTALAVAATMVAGGYFLHGLMAAQGQGVLAQAPLNTQVQVTPAFIMAVDDSGSMNFQTLFPGRDGAVAWGRDSSSGQGNVYSYFHNTGASRGFFREAGTSGNRNVHVAPYPAPRQNAGSDRDAGIPPFDSFGFSRSHEYNRSYFDPREEYRPWRNEDGTYWDPVTPDAARVHPASASPTVDMTEWREVNSTGASNDSRFAVRTGMMIPAGTRYRGSGCGLSNSGTSFREQTTEHVSTGECNLQIGYFPATFYLHETSPAPVGFIEANRVFAANACTYPTAAGSDVCNMYRYEIRPGNYSSAALYDEAIQNFANWFTYYGARSRAIVAGMTISLAEVNNMRIGQFAINDNSDWDNPVGSASERLPMYDMQVQSERISLFERITGLTVSGTTPNMSAVRAIGEQFRRTDSNAPIQLACQKNAGMLFTDGFTNQSNMSGFGNVDGSLGAPFADNNNNTMADIATYYYLNTDGSIGGGGTSRLGGYQSPARGQVPVPEACSSPNPDPRFNCQSNLHMNFYGVTLGATGVLFDPESPADPFVTAPEWPGHVNNSANTVDDIWHATVNTRGEFINASTPADITKAMRRVLASVRAGETPSGSLALTGARIGSGSLTVVPEYEVSNNGTDWFSRLVASSVSVNSIGSVELTEEWRAEDEFPAPASRQVYYTSGGTTKRFNATNVALADLCSTPTTLYTGMSLCSAAEITALGVDASDAVDYLLGSQVGEKRNGGTLRDRAESILGDIVNSTPTVSAPIDDYGYGVLAGTLGTSYRTYLTTKRSSQRYMVYVGANDGMLHAFDGGMGANGVMDSSGGKEVFAYIPATSIGHMGNLLFPYDPTNENDQKFAHRYFVDGPVTVSDAHYNTNWATVVVGTSGAGGRSVFALDVTSPSSFGPSSQLWEISDVDATLDASVRANIGHVLGRPIVVPVKTTAGTSRWVALFGNGYNSASGKAVLFMVDIDSGTPTIRMIEATASGTIAGSNGLGNIVAVDRWGGSDLTSGVRDGYVDTVYGGDQKGNLWKFDLRAPSPANVTVPLFQTATHTESSSTYRQPIIGGLTAAIGPSGGVMLYFGTGSFSFLGDLSDTRTQTLYAVNDIQRGAVTATVSRSNLQPWTVSTVAGNRKLTLGTATVNSRGWYVDLPAGERFVGNPRIATGTIFLATYAPEAANSGCSTRGFNWLFGLNARTGAPSLSNVRFGSIDGASPPSGTAAVALDTGGTAPVRDVGVMAIPRIDPPGPPPPGGGGGGGPPPAPEHGCWMMVTVAGAQQMYLPYPCGRQSWRQLQ